MQTIGAERAEEHGANEAVDEPCMGKGVGHGQDPRAQRSLEQMHKGLCISKIIKQMHFGQLFVQCIQMFFLTWLHFR